MDTTDTADEEEEDDCTTALDEVTLHDATVFGCTQFKGEATAAGEAAVDEGGGDDVAVGSGGPVTNGTGGLWGSRGKPGAPTDDGKGGGGAMWCCCDDGMICGGAWLG